MNATKVNSLASELQPIDLILILHTAYDGLFCEEDRNGCAEASCFSGVQCYDVPAPGVGITCGPCPNGYFGDGKDCIGQ